MATVIVAARGYRQRLEREPPGAAQTVLAAIPDMASMRAFTDICRSMCHELDKLDSTMRDHTHYLRDKIEIEREVCQRLRELREEIVRSDRQHFRGGGA